MSRLALAIAVKGAWDADQLVAALEAAGVPAGTEVHVACDPQFAPSAPPPSLFVHVTTGASLFELWGVAIANGSSAWVAVLHAAALPAPGWFAAMTREIERDGQSDGYWGPIEPKPAIAADRMLGYLTEYCQFHRPVEPGLREVPGSNLVLPRERIGAATDFSKTRLLGQGLAPKYVADAVVLYARPNPLAGYCRRRFSHGRAFAAARTPHLPLVQAFPLCAALPFVRTGRIVRHAWRHRELRGVTLRLVPAILLAESCWSAGELIGYVTRRAGDAAALD